MKILSVDTVSKICSVAVLEDTKILKEISLDNGLTHSETLMVIIKQILDELNLKLTDIDLFSCDKGPGSFTGIRIGIATIKAFSDSLGTSVIGINSLEALCYNETNNRFICPMIDAKKENVYVSLFENTNNSYICKIEPTYQNINKFLENLKPLNLEDIIFIGDASIFYKENILKVFPNSKFSQNNNLSAANVGLAGFNNHKQDSTHDLLPFYLRKSQAEIVLEEKCAKK